MQFKPYYFESIYFDMYSYVASCISSQLIVAFLDFLGTNLEAAKNQLRTTVTFFFSDQTVRLPANRHRNKMHSKYQCL